MAIGTLATIGPVGSGMVPNYWADFLRDNLFPNLYFRQFGTRVAVPQGNGNTVKIPRWKTTIKPGATTASTTFGTHGISAMTVTGGVAIGAMTEGTPPAVNSGMARLNAESISGFITAWSGAFAYSDRAILVSKADYIAGAVKELGRQLAVTLDDYHRAKLSGTATTMMQLINGTLGKTGTAPLIASNLARVAPKLEALMVPTWDDEMYVAMINPLAKVDLFNDISGNGFIPVHMYGNQDMIYRGEIGSMFGLRFVSSTAIKKYVGTAATTATVGLSVNISGANMYVFAPDGFYGLEHSQGGFEVIHHPPGSSGAYDSTNQIGTIGCKAYYGLAIGPTADRRVTHWAHTLSVTTA